MIFESTESTTESRMNGMWHSISSLRTFINRSKPSISGIRASLMIRSQACFSRMARASAPFFAERTP